MYFWKCWRDNRFRFIVCLSMFAGVAAFPGLAAVAVYSNETGWSLVLSVPPERLAVLWRQVTLFLVPTTLMVAILAGIGLGATGVGDEFRSGTLEFLLARPRSRRYFLWTGWLCGAAQMLLMACAAAAAALAMLFALSGTVQTWRVWLVIPVALTAGAVTFGLTYFLIVVTRNSHHGQNFALLLVMLYPLIVFSVNYWWQIKLPSLWDLMPGAPLGHGRADPTGQFYTKVAFPIASLLGWSAVAVAFPFAAQLVFDRAEI